MYNWNTNITELKKDPEKYTVWRLEQLINYGLNDKRLNKKQLIKYWDKISIDTKKRDALTFLLWKKKS